MLKVIEVAQIEQNKRRNWRKNKTMLKSWKILSLNASVTSIRVLKKSGGWKPKHIRVKRLLISLTKRYLIGNDIYVISKFSSIRKKCFCKASCMGLTIPYCTSSSKMWNIGRKGMSAWPNLLIMLWEIYQVCWRNLMLMCFLTMFLGLFFTLYLFVGWYLRDLRLIFL